MIDEIQYWHDFEGDGVLCTKVLPAGIHCHGTREQHPVAEWGEPELPEGMSREIEWEATHDKEYGYTLKLDLTKSEHDRLIVALKKESYDPAIRKILSDIVGYDEAVEQVKEYERNRVRDSNS